MLHIEEWQRIENRRLLANLIPILEMLRGILDSSTVIAKAQAERDLKPGKKVYSVVTLFLQYVFKEILDVGYDEVWCLMFTEFCEVTRLPKDKEGKWRKPRGSTIHEFRTDILEPMLDELMMEIAVTMMNRVNIVRRGDGYVVVTIDSTPAEASRYNFDAEFNKHYNVRMDKLHIIMIDGCPLFMIATDGNTHDSVPVEDLFTKFDEGLSQSDLDRKALKVMADGGYDSFRIFDIVYRITGKIMNCHIRAGSAIHAEATWPALQAKYSRMHKRSGFDPNRKNDVDFVLQFLGRNGQGELVGMYLRDRELERLRKQLEDGEKDTDREVCETVHHSMKSWVNLTTKKLRHATRHAVLRCKFVVTQLISMVLKGYVNYESV